MDKDRERLRSLFGDALYSDRELLEADIAQVSEVHRPAVLRALNDARELWKSGDARGADYLRDEALVNLGQAPDLFGEERVADNPRVLVARMKGEPVPAEAEDADDPRVLARDLQVY